MSDKLSEVSDISFPPIFSTHRCVPPADPFAEACSKAAAGQLGAADVVYSSARDVAALAIVLEPDVARGAALQMLPLMMVAIGDSLGTLMPPKVAIQYRWPRTLLVNGAPAGFVSLMMAGDAGSPDRPPDWIVLGAQVSLLNLAASGEPGEAPDTTSLAEEGAPDLTSAELITSLGAHFLAWLDIWSDDGFAPVEAQWRFRSDAKIAPGEVLVGLEREDLITPGWGLQP